MAKAAKPKSSRAKSSRAISVQSKSGSSGAKRKAPRSASHLSTYREHEKDDEPTKYYYRSDHPPMFGGVFEGHSNEFAGLGLIAFGILLVLSVYLESAGPVGGVLDDALLSLIGGGRYFLPALSFGLGIALAIQKDWQLRSRNAIGWALFSSVLLGLGHIYSNDSAKNPGGWIGWLFSEPITSSFSDTGATALLAILVVCSVMLITGKSVIELCILIWRLMVGANSYIAQKSQIQEDSAGANRLDMGFDNPEDFDGESAQLFDFSLDPELEDIDDEEVVESELVDEQPKPKRGRKRRGRAEAKLAPVKGELQEIPLGPSGQPSAWTLPEIEFLSLTTNKKANEQTIRDRGDQLVAALASHGVETVLVGYTRGPTVTRYELSLGDGVKVAKVTSLSRDIAYTMAATDVRILAPIPGRSAIGIEVPNELRELVSIGDLLVSQEARTANHPLDVAVGKDISGRSVFLNISTTPHLLIAGATGAGKSSAINCIITSVLMRATPDQVKMILIDPKQVEMGQYARLPHLLTAPVTNPKKAANALGWAVKEMERRYDVLVEAGFRDIAGYNAAYDRGEMSAEAGQPADKKFERIPYVLIVVDELNDLMMVAARDVEDCITRIAQKARAVGIHLIVATQRPSVNVITGVIKANIPARMAFAVSSLTDSRVILDQPGAEKLIGMGDMLMLPGNTSVSQRLQSAWVSENEVKKVVGHWRRQAPEVTYVSGVEGEANASGGAPIFGGSSGDEGDDELMRQAMDLVVRAQQGSTSMLQRKLKVGFARAGRLMDMLEQRGVVAASEGSRPREVLMSIEELELIQKAS